MPVPLWAPSKWVGQLLIHANHAQPFPVAGLGGLPRSPTERMDREAYDWAHSSQLPQQVTEPLGVLSTSLGLQALSKGQERYHVLPRE